MKYIDETLLYRVKLQIYFPPLNGLLFYDVLIIHQSRTFLTLIFSLPKRPKLNATTSNRSSSSGSKNFALIHKVVNHMKELHLSGEPRKMTVSEILEECQSQSSGEFFDRKYREFQRNI